MVVGGVAMNNLDDRQPFNSHVKYVGPRTEEDLEELTKHLQQAECGNAQSQYWVATALRTGFNTSPDWVEIYKWYRLAEEQNYAPAAEATSALKVEMTADDLAAGEHRARQFTPRSENCPVAA